MEDLCFFNYIYMPLLYVIVFLALGKKEDEGEDKCEKLRNRDCPPYTVHTKEYRKYKNRRGLKNQRSHKRYCCGNRTVVESCKKR